MCHKPSPPRGPLFLLLLIIQHESRIYTEYQRQIIFSRLSSHSCDIFQHPKKQQHIKIATLISPLSIPWVTLLYEVGLFELRVLFATSALPYIQDKYVKKRINPGGLGNSLHVIGLALKNTAKRKKKHLNQTPCSFSHQ